MHKKLWQFHFKNFVWTLLNYACIFSPSPPQKNIFDPNAFFRTDMHRKECICKQSEVFLYPVLPPPPKKCYNTFLYIFLHSKCIKVCLETKFQDWTNFFLRTLVEDVKLHLLSFWIKMITKFLSHLHYKTFNVIPVKAISQLLWSNFCDEWY